MNLFVETKCLPEANGVFEILVELLLSFGLTDVVICHSATKAGYILASTIDVLCMKLAKI